MSIDGRIEEDAGHMHSRVLLSHKEEWNHAICSNTDGSQWDSKRQISYDIAYVWNLKERIQTNLFTNQKQSQEWHSWLTGDKGGEG